MHKTIYIILLALCFSKVSAQTNEQPNIIFFLSDDQRWDTFGFMGNEHIITPNCDKLAENGIVFTNAYHVSPICKPSRASLMLGQYLSTHRCGFDQPTMYTISEDEFSQSYAVQIRKAGYFTGFVGKFGFPVTEDKIFNADKISHTEKRDAKSQLWLQDECMPKDEYDLWYGFAGQGVYDVNGKHGTEHRGDQALNFIQKAAQQEKPFALQVSFKAPHSPFQPDEKYLKLYENIDIPRAPNDTEEAHNQLPAVVKEKYRGRNAYSDKKYQAFIKKYYALITGLDVVVGRVMDELLMLGLDDNTIIIFSSDNGYFCGSKGLAGKDLLYEESAKAPLIIMDPRLSKQQKGTSINKLTSIIDLAPTILDYASVDIPHAMEGRSLLPLIDNPELEIHEAVYGENHFANFAPLFEELSKDEQADYSSVRSRFIRTPQYKYIQYYECRPMIEELWDIARDPSEMHNLVNNPDYQEILEKMRQLMADYRPEKTKN
ncbi:sulfatase-like hydrolase/transferase [Carboxylicivirga marina]|uniref:sulfatase-like hydrolase/transferase n=1 Tax=Carboxylicivirga marina TaxID=2800988 RepID=UPI002597B4F5|nr:sulfatase-like hydrolase/transferase [uncultured Carboxylicivirga sp.]